MELRGILREGGFKAALESTTKDDVIRELVDLLVRAEGLGDTEAVLACILERESKMSTGMQQGIAIPHGKCSTVTRLAAAVGIKAEGLDFQSLDGKPSRIFVVTVCPPDSAGPHMQFLAELSKRLNDPEVRDGVIAAATFSEFIDCLDKPHVPVSA